MQSEGSSPHGHPAELLGAQGTHVQRDERRDLQKELFPVSCAGGGGRPTCGHRGWAFPWRTQSPSVTLTSCEWDPRDRKARLLRGWPTGGQLSGLGPGTQSPSEAAALAPVRGDGQLGPWTRCPWHSPTAFRLHFQRATEPSHLRPPPNFRGLWLIESLTLAFLLGGRGFGKAVVGAAAWGSSLVQDTAELSRLSHKARLGTSAGCLSGCWDLGPWAMKRDVTVPPRPPAARGLRMAPAPGSPCHSPPRCPSGLWGAGRWRLLPGASCSQVGKKPPPHLCPGPRDGLVNPLVVPRGSELPKGRVPWAAAGPPKCECVQVCVLRRGRAPLRGGCADVSL